jgi:Tfp pilus assembly protein FimV
MFDSAVDTEHAFAQDRAMARTHVRRRGTGVAAALVVGLVVGAPLARAVGGARPMRPAAEQRYVVGPGDTLWGVATRVVPGSDPRRVVDAIARENQVEDARIVPGQVLVIPTIG